MRRRAAPPTLLWIVTASLLLACAPAAALAQATEDAPADEEPPVDEVSEPSPPPPPRENPKKLEDEAAFRRLSQPPKGYARVVMTLAFGDGLRFNNPYRLQTQLGETGESLSLTQPYIDLGAAFSLGPPNGLQHGASLRLTASIAGVSQQVLTPSYFVAYRGPRRVLAFGRLGSAILLSPDAGVGPELAAGISYFVSARFGFFGELVGNLFYGAGTTEVRYAVYPILSAQLGLMIDSEILP
jgi:hypothetical protein